MENHSRWYFIGIIFMVVLLLISMSETGPLFQRYVGTFWAGPLMLCIYLPIAYYLPHHFGKGLEKWLTRK